MLYLNIYGYLVGKKVFILGSGDIGLIMARRMTLEGAQVLAVAELMPYSGGLKRKIVQCLNMLDEESVGESEYYKYLKDEMALYSGLETNKAAPQFSVVTTDGDTLSLDHYYNKNLYLFFTASWCDSCETFARELDEVHRRFKSPGFEVLAISLDKTQEGLDDLVERSCGWQIACDFQYWESQITKRYGVQKIPYGVLIDNKQRICAVNPSIQALSYKLRILQNE
mgnify:CR=1 FL=1